jgi:hypothetical protein
MDGGTCITTPDSIPAEYRQPFKTGGLIPGQAELSTSRGVAIDSNNALLENTPRNGARTAVEDFLSETKLTLRFQSVIGSHGVGILVSEQQLEENEDLRRRLEELKSAEWLQTQCQHLEGCRLLLTVQLAEAQRQLAAIRQERSRLAVGERASRG